MEYRKLNLKDGPEEDLHTFMRLLKASYDEKTAGAINVINMEMLSKLLASGFMTAHVAIADGVAVGVATIEFCPVWYSNSMYYCSRLSFIEPAQRTPTTEALFTQYIAQTMKTQDPEGTHLFVVMPDDRQSSIIHACGFTPYADTYRA